MAITKKTNKELSFEQALDKLNGIVAQMEDAETGLEETLALYKQGVELSALCMSELNSAEAEIAALTKTLDGIFAVPFEGEES